MSFQFLTFLVILFANNLISKSDKGEKIILGRERAEIECKDRKCCLNKIASNKNLVNCQLFDVIQCVENDNFCEWNCNNNQEQYINSINKKFKRFLGFQNEIGIYRELNHDDIVNNNNQTNNNIIQTVNDLIDITSTVTMDDCGLIYEEKLYLNEAIKLFNKLTQNQNQNTNNNNNNNDKQKKFGISIDSNGALNINPNKNKQTNDNNNDNNNNNNDINNNNIFKSDPERRRLSSSSLPSSLPSLIRRLIPGLFGSDGRKQIKTNTYPYSTNGFLSFQTSDGGYSWCTATLISKRTLITAGHCVASNAKYFKNFKFYPGAYGYPLPQSFTATHIQTFNYWYYNNNFEYDIGIIRLSVHDTNKNFLSFGYLNVLNNPIKFNIMGYASDKHKNQPFSHWQQSAEYTIIKPHILGSTESDLPPGSSGSPVYIYYEKENKYVIYCIVSHILGNTYNNCARITEAKYNAICDFIEEGDEKIC